MRLRKMLTCAAPCAAIVAACLATARPARAVAVPLNPVADAFVTTGPTSNLSGNNYGGAGALSVAASGSSKGEFQSVMRFDVSSAKATFDATYGAGNWTIQSVSLQLTAQSPSNAIFNASVTGNFTVSFMQDDTWVEGTGNPNTPTTDGITFTTLPTYVSGSDPALGTFSSAAPQPYVLGRPAGFVSDLSAGGLTSLRLFAADASVSYLVNSRSIGTQSTRPVLTIDAVPEPSTATLAAAACATLLARRRRHA